MKFGIVGTIVLVAIVLVIAWVIVGARPQEAVAPLTSPDPNQQLTDATTKPGGGQFIQLAPTDVPFETDDTVEIEEVVDVDAEDSTGTTVNVVVDEAGFTPNVLTIAVGDTVTFVNDGQGKHWPASDLHPTHKILPEFDSKRGLETGEEYSYTFSEAGTWKCHDHLVAANTCTIVVE